MPIRRSAIRGRMKQRLAALGFIVALAAVSDAFAADWPCYGGDAQRSGRGTETLRFPLGAAWRYEAPQAPAPAWPEPEHEMHRIDFDYAFQPVVAEGLVIFGSSADDAIRALELATGALRWRFTTGGPVRFAPHIVDGKCYAATDAGMVHCLDLQTGAPIWAFDAALDGRQVPGNGRMISRWPCRAGVLVDDGVLYVAAGMWPAEGILIRALDAEDGREIWCNDTSGGQFMSYPHGGALAIGGVSPQGYLAATAGELLVPTGRSLPAVYDRTTGELLYYRIGEYRADGGWRVTASTDAFYSRTHAGKWPMTAAWTRFGPRPGDGIKKFRISDGQEAEALPARHFIIDAGDIRYLAGDGVLEARHAEGVRWTARHPRVFSLAASANVLLVGGAHSLSAFSLDNGSAVWRKEVDGEVRGIAVADGRVLASSHTGAIICFASDVSPSTPYTLHQPATERSARTPWAAETVPKMEHLDLSPFTRGYALLVGESTAGAAEALLKQTELHVILLLSDGDKIESLRDKLQDTTRLYGRRISVQHLADPAVLPFPDFFANLIVAGDPLNALSAGELTRVLRPCGGVLVVASADKTESEALLAQLDATDAQLRATGVGAQRIRGKLPGALDWDSETTSDQRLRWPLELSWFGGPGPARLPNRHTAMLPVAANGRYFVVGSHHLIAVDAYNGTELWCIKIQDLLNNLGVLAADDTTVYVNFGSKCLTLDAQTGVQKAVYQKAMDEAAWSRLPAHARIPRGMPPTAPEETRTSPLTGEQEVLAYRRAYGCGSFISSATMHFFRSATLGMYDLEDDSGLRNFSGVRPGCALSLMPALGVLISNDGDVGCTCSYNFQTSLVMAPARTMHNEDWAIYYDKPAYGITRRIALNLGAPGDRRDESRQLWLALPRPETGLQLDCELDVTPGFGPRRVNADRTEIEGTSRPWLHASAIHGLRRLALDLEHFDDVVSPKTAHPPTLDGLLTDACWDDTFPLEVNDEPTTVYLRHDADHFYLAFRRLAATDRRGTVTPWKAALQGADQPIWEDDSCEIILSDSTRKAGLHLGLSASSARYDGLWSYADPYPGFDVPHLEGITIDGRDDDWLERGFRVDGMADAKGNMRAPDNLDASLRLGWNDEGLLVFVRVRDDVVVEYSSQSSMWMRDSLELFMAESRDSKNRFQLCVGPGVDDRQPRTRMFFWDRRRHKAGVSLSAQAMGVRTEDGYVVEMLLPWSNLGIRPEAAREVAFQIEVNDSDRPKGGRNDWFRIGWHPGGHTAFKADALHRLRLGAKTSPPDRRERASRPDSLGLVKSGPAINAPPLSIPRLDAITIDGDATDWAAGGFHQRSMVAQDATMRDEASFDPSMRVGWNALGLLLLVEVRDDQVVVDPDPERLWRKDSIEVFMAPGRGIKESLQFTAALSGQGTTAQLHTHLNDNRGKLKRLGELTVEAQGVRTDDGYRVEMLLPWKHLGIRPDLGREIALQVHVSDSDDTEPYPADWFRAAWYPHGHAGWDPLAYHRLLLAEEATPPVRFERGRRVNDERWLATEPYPWTMPEAIKGKSGEDTAWNATWQGAVRTNETSFVCELAVPWQALARAGIDRDRLTVDFSHRGRVAERPSYSFMPVDLRAGSAAPARPYTVNLHFTELENVAPGERVFDVLLQGKTVLEDLDVVSDSGGPGIALTKSFPHVMAARTLELKWRQKTDKPPFCSGIEIVEE